MTIIQGTNAKPHDCQDHLVLYRGPTGEGYAECKLCGSRCYIPPHHKNKLPAWFYFLAYALGILTAIAFLVVIVHEIWRMNHLPH